MIEDRRLERNREIAAQGPHANVDQATPRAGTFARTGQ
jgi:hypothetical protein